jgi:Flp pilus assembly protein TadB
MKNNISIIIVALFAVLICLILVASLFYSVSPRFLITLSLSVGIVTGILITVIIQTLVRNIRNRRLKNEMPPL